MHIKLFLALLLLLLVIEVSPRRYGGRSRSSRSRTSRWSGRRSTGRRHRWSWGRRQSHTNRRRRYSRSWGSNSVRTAPVYKPNPSGQSQYSSFPRPSYNTGRYSTGGHSYGSRAPGGYGTNWGTSFPSGGVGRYNGVSKKALGLGIGAGFLGGAALGMAGTMATYSVYHRYHQFQRMMYMNNPNYGRGMDNGYYNNYYSRNQCLGGCPTYSHCEWGFCECDGGMTRSYGSCQTSQGTPRPQNFDPLIQCSSTTTCSALDMNLVCNTNLTTGGAAGRCQCRTDMRWNREAGECQIYMDVDCSAYNYDTPVSETVMTAVQKAKQDIADAAGCPAPSFLCDDSETCILASQICDGVADCPTTETSPGGEEEQGCTGSGDGPEEDDTNSSLQPSLQRCGEGECLDRTESKNESLATSLLTKIDPNTATAEELTEAFCRDIDAFSFEFQEQYDVDERPSLLCDKIPPKYCAVAYDSSVCDGGWRFGIYEGDLRFRFWSAYYAYRNDMDLIAVRAGCTFTGYTDSHWDGDSAVITATGADRWVVFAREYGYQHMDEEIESVRCYCGGNLTVTTHQ